MLAKYLILILSTESQGAACDVVHQTTRVLAKRNRVIVFEPKVTTTLSAYIKHAFKHRAAFYQSQQKQIFCQVSFVPELAISLVHSHNPSFALWLRYLNQVFSGLLLLVLLFPSFAKSKRSVFWVCFPQLYYLIKMFQSLPNKVVVYDVFDEQTTTERRQQTKLTEYKIKLLKQANIITAISHTLKKRYQELHPQAEINLVPQGFALDTFSETLRHGNLQQDQLPWQNNRPVVGFVGGISDRFDHSLLNELAEIEPSWQLVLVGPIQLEQNVNQPRRLAIVKRVINKIPNILHYPQQSKERVPAIINSFDVCIIPYDVSLDFNRYCYPMKLFEYFYMGKPVVSTPIEELARPEFADFVKIGATANEWQQHIKQLLAKPWSDNHQRRQRQLAIDNSWQNKVEVISDIIQQYQAR